MSTPSPRPHDLADRYGAPSPGRRRLVVGGATLGGLLFLGWVGWAAFFHSTPTASSELLGFEVVSDHATTARVDVHVDGEPAEVGASCRIAAYAADHTLVGELAWTPEQGQHEVEIRTERRATSVELAGCTTEGQPRPR